MIIPSDKPLLIREHRNGVSFKRKCWKRGAYYYGGEKKVVFV